MSEKGSILFVDDNENMCTTMAMVFEHIGYDTHTAFDGADAVEAVREKTFDIIFMDIKMPNLNGVEALHEIKKSPPRGNRGHDDSIHQRRPGLGGVQRRRI